VSSSRDFAVAVIGAGVVGAAVTYALARRGVAACLLEAEDEPGLGASGTNSGILHAAFDSPPGELETEMILRSAALRDAVLDRLGIPVVRCGAVVTPGDEGERKTVAALAEGARQNGVEARLRDDGALEVPSESVTDPAAYTRALAAAAVGGGAELRTGAPVVAIERSGQGLSVRTASGESFTCTVAVNCAGVRGDEVARLGGDASFEIYPRKGEFFVFDPPDGQPLERILLPVPTKRTKGVLVFPTVDGRVIAGPTAHDQVDKDDWSVRPEAFEQVMPKAVGMLPSLEGSEPIASYAGLRPAGRDVNYLIGPSNACHGLFNVAAIRSTGVSASLGIAERVVSMLEAHGIELGADRDLPAAGPDDGAAEPWWRRAARRGAVV
jgi:glycerol-3-phosphate dehydrogenase